MWASSLLCFVGCTEQSPSLGFVEVNKIASSRLMINHSKCSTLIDNVENLMRTAKNISPWSAAHFSMLMVTFGDFESL